MPTSAKDLCTVYKVFDSAVLMSIPAATTLFPEHSIIQPHPCSIPHRPYCQRFTGERRQTPVGRLPPGEDPALLPSFFGAVQ